ncbi:hypothetical protein R6Q59_005116 [Mikania micrantha]
MGGKPPHKTHAFSLCTISTFSKELVRAPFDRLLGTARRWFSPDQLEGGRSSGSISHLRLLRPLTTIATPPVLMAAATTTTCLLYEFAGGLLFWPLSLAETRNLRRKLRYAPIVVCEGEKKEAEKGDVDVKEASKPNQSPALEINFRK